MNIFRKPVVLIDAQGQWKVKDLPKGANPVYRDSMISYVNAFGPLFEKAKDTCEFEFILTLLRVKGLEDPGWDPFENTQEVFKCISKLERKINDFYVTRHLFLWLYGHIVEASEPYEILANLIRICEGGHYKIDNFPAKKRGKYSIPPSPSEKIDQLEKMALNINMGRSIFPLKDLFDRDLRNAVFHSDYSLYGGELRIRKPTKSYSHKDINKIMNKGLAYFNSFMSIFNGYIRSYDESKVIEVHKDFGGHPNEKTAIIIRKGHGLAGIKDNWTIEELKRGYIPHRIGCFSKYERKLLDRDPQLTILPESKVDRINRVLKILPKFISKRIVKKMMLENAK